MLRAFGYIRVSGDEQADRGLPVAGQRERIQRYAAEHDMELDHVYVDEARPGSSDVREQFQLMMRVAHQDPPPAGAVIIWSWSRFARDQDDAHFWKASLRRHGVQILSVEDAVPQGTGMDYIFEALIHWKDEKRLEEIGHDARRGQQTLAALGYIPSGCPAPRGYRVELEAREIEGRRRRLRRWVPDPDVAPIARRAWELRLSGASYQTVIRETGLFRSNGSLSTFYCNTAYKGYVSFGGTRVEVEPIVTPEEWAAVNAARPARKSGAYARRKGSRFLLSGLLRCALCGSALAGDYSPAGERNDGHRRQQWDHYRCLTSKRGGDCALPRIAAVALERSVLGYVYSEILDQNAMETHWAELESARDALRPTIEAQIHNLLAELDTTRRRIENLIRVIEQTANATLVGRLSQRELDAQGLEAQIAALQSQLTARPPMPDIDAIRERLQNALENDRQAARELLRTLILDVTVSEEDILVRGKMPGF